MNQAIKVLQRPEIELQKPRPIGFVDDLGIDSSLPFSHIMAEKSKEVEDDQHKGGLKSMPIASKPVEQDYLEIQSWTAEVTPKSSSLSLRNIIVNTTIQTVTGCGLYGLVKPLLM